MKVKTLSLLAGASAFALASAATASLDFNVIEASDAYLTDNGLRSVSVYITGLNDGDLSLGVLGTGTTPWILNTSDGSALYNTASMPPFWDGSGIRAGDAALEPWVPGISWDSGFLLSQAFDLHAGGIGAPFQAGNGDYSGDGIGALIDGSGNGVEYNSANNPNGLGIYRLTWNADADLSIQFLFETVGAGSIAVAWSSTPVPAPGALALLGLAGLVGARRRRA